MRDLAVGVARAAELDHPGDFLLRPGGIARLASPASLARLDGWRSRGGREDGRPLRGGVLLLVGLGAGVVAAIDEEVPSDLAFCLPRLLNGGSCWTTSLVLVLPFELCLLVYIVLLEGLSHGRQTRKPSLAIVGPELSAFQRGEASIAAMIVAAHPPAVLERLEAWSGQHSEALLQGVAQTVVKWWEWGTLLHVCLAGKAGSVDVLWRLSKRLWLGRKLGMRSELLWPVHNWGAVIVGDCLFCLKWLVDLVVLVVVGIIVRLDGASDYR